jgi:hypothetical protein
MPSSALHMRWRRKQQRAGDNPRLSLGEYQIGAKQMLREDAQIWIDAGLIGLSGITWC